MTDELTQSEPTSDNNLAEAQIRQQLSSMDIRLASTDIEVEVNNAIKLPFDQIPALGVALGSLPETFRTITTSFDVPTLLQATDSAGKKLNPAILNEVHNGSGKIGSYMDPVNGLSQARFHNVDPGAITSKVTIPYNPTTLFFAAALAQINQKLDAIQNTVNEILEYMKLRDESNLRGNITTLENILEAYRHNWNNEVWKATEHNKVEDIKQSAEQDLVLFRSQIKQKLGEKDLLEIRASVDNRLNKILDLLKVYQLAVYAYSFAAFLEPMLCENFSEGNLTAIASKINDHRNEYHELHTECHNAIEASAQSSVDSVVLGGFASTLSGFGSFIKQTPIGQFTPIDEALEDAGRGIGDFNNEQTRNLMDKLSHAETPNIAPFQECIETVNILHNKPQQIAADKDNIYILREEN